MRAQAKNIKGFNILELLVVMAIIAVVSATAYPQFNTWNKEREVRRSVEEIKSLMKNIFTQTERGTFGFVQVHFENTSEGLVVTSKGMTMQSLATKMNNGSDPWNNTLPSPRDRCKTEQTTPPYWDTDMDNNATDDEGNRLFAEGFGEKLKAAAYSLTLKDVIVAFPGTGEGSGAVCFARNGRFYEGNDLLLKPADDDSNLYPQPYNFVYICRVELQSCPINKGESTDGYEKNPSDTEVKHLRSVKWGRYGNFSTGKWDGGAWVE